LKDESDIAKITSFLKKQLKRSIDSGASHDDGILRQYLELERRKKSEFVKQEAAHRDGLEIERESQSDEAS
jgi:hypothetical protein